MQNFMQHQDAFFVKRIGLGLIEMRQKIEE
jgi:hypothetical protein